MLLGISSRDRGEAGVGLWRRVGLARSAEWSGTGRLVVGAGDLFDFRPREGYLLQNERRRSSRVPTRRSFDDDLGNARTAQRRALPVPDKRQRASGWRG